MLCGETKKKEKDTTSNSATWDQDDDDDDSIDHIIKNEIGFGHWMPIEISIQGPCKHDVDDNDFTTAKDRFKTSFLTTHKLILNPPFKICKDLYTNLRAAQTVEE